MDIRIPLDRALDLLVALGPYNPKASFLRRAILDTTLGAAGYVRGGPPAPNPEPDPAPEQPAPWTPKVGERVMVEVPEEDPLFGAVVEILRLTGAVGVRVERGESPTIIRYFPPSWIRPAEEAR